MKYKVIGQKIEFLGSSALNRLRGRRPSQRISAIMDVSDLTLSDIARIYAANRFTTTLQEKIKDNVVVSAKTNLSHVLAGRDNSPAYIRAIETAWKLPIEEIRRIYREDKERILAHAELIHFKLEYAKAYFPEKAEEYLFAIHHYGSAA